MARLNHKAQAHERVGELSLRRRAAGNAREVRLLVSTERPICAQVVVPKICILRPVRSMMRAPEAVHMPLPQLVNSGAAPRSSVIAILRITRHRTQMSLILAGLERWPAKATRDVAAP